MELTTQFAKIESGERDSLSSEKMRLNLEKDLSQSALDAGKESNFLASKEIVGNRFSFSFQNILTFADWSEGKSKKSDRYLSTSSVAALLRRAASKKEANIDCL